MPEVKLDPTSLSMLKEQAAKIPETETRMRLGAACHKGSQVYAYYERGDSHITLVCAACEEPFLQLYLGEKPEYQPTQFQFNDKVTMKGFAQLGHIRGYAGNNKWLVTYYDPKIKQDVIREFPQYQLKFYAHGEVK